jgi:hypothetical protein
MTNRDGSAYERYTITHLIRPHRNPRMGWWWRIDVDGVTWDYGTENTYRAAAKACIKASGKLEDYFEDEQ